MTPESNGAIDEVLIRVQGEFLEMPGLRLTTRQAGRRFLGHKRHQVDSDTGILEGEASSAGQFRAREGVGNAQIPSPRGR